MRISYCVYKRTLTQYALRNTQNSASGFSVFRASFENLIQGRQVRLEPFDELAAGMIGERLVPVGAEGFEGATMMFARPLEVIRGTLLELRTASSKSEGEASRGSPTEEKESLEERAREASDGNGCEAENCIIIEDEWKELTEKRTSPVRRGGLEPLPKDTHARRVLCQNPVKIWRRPLESVTIAR